MSEATRTSLPARQAAPDDVLAGVDVGGSTIVVILATVAELRPLGRYQTRTVIGRPSEASHQIAEAVRHAFAESGIPQARLAGVGIGVPGRVDPHGGTVQLALNLGWRDISLREEVEADLRVPVSIDNDVRTAAHGLALREVLGPVRDLVYISVGTGIAAGIVLDGEIRHGERGLAGEIGHIVVERDGKLCVCGLRGCLETKSSGPAVATLAASRMADGETSSLSSEVPFSAREVYAAAQQGDALATDVVEEAGAHLARVIRDLALTVDVERICLGGGVASAGPSFLAPIERELDRFRSASELDAEALPHDLIQLLPSDSDPGPWGALYLARKGRTSRSVRESDREEVSRRPATPTLTA